MLFKRIHIIIMDSFGIGALPDAFKFGDEGSNTFYNILKKYKLNILNFKKMGLYEILNKKNEFRFNNKLMNCLVMKLKEESCGKDTIVGHFELMGVKTIKPFNVFLNGFPDDLINKIENFSKRKVICNKVYSGTDVIKDYGELQLKTGSLIIYTSSDSVLQIAANEKIISLNELYKICKIVRNIIDIEKKYNIARVIARPFIIKNKIFLRTNNRKDFTIDFQRRTILDELKDNNKEVIAIGKINDIFSGKGITKKIYTKNNIDGILKMIKIFNKEFIGLSFTNLVDFDMLYGHRRDVKGYAKAIEEFDSYIPIIIKNMKIDDLLIITADHGNDPTFRGFDHTREYVPLIAFSKKNTKFMKLKDGCFSDLAATIAENFNIFKIGNGKSFLNFII